MFALPVCLLSTCLCAVPLASAKPLHRTIPRPLPAHPGNIFISGETVIVPAPPGEAPTWRLIDYEGTLVVQGQVKDGQAELGRFSPGYYEVLRPSGATTNRVAVGVLEPLRALTPLSSPIGSDVAMAWLVKAEQQSGLASLCALAGLNRVRDRLNWEELEPTRGTLVASSRYDASVAAQAAAGLQVLEVSHRSPHWANTNAARFPLDLRDIYNYHRALGQRWRGSVEAFEPWNEADISMFGGHTGSEMAALQKAAYLGIKAANPKATACWNVLALHRASTLSDLHENAPWPYCDTFNLHHYETFAKLPQLYADFRAVSAGKPLWVTECSVPVKWRGDARQCEPGPEDLRLQSERVAMTYAMTLHEGAQAVFYFVLPHYVEGQTQFGLLRPDLTPRPAFVAMAAVGRLLADARPQGQLVTGTNSVQGYLFSARPDGHRAQVLVLWSEQETTFTLPKPPRACFDHLGRSLAFSGPALRLSRAPQFVLLASGTRLPLVPPPSRPAPLPGKVSPIVLQALFPEQSVLLNQSAYKIPADQSTSFPLFVYNFGAKKALGRLSATLPAGWTADFHDKLAVAPGERQEVRVRLTPGGPGGPAEAKLKVAGDFGPAGEPVLSLRLLRK